MFSTKERKKEEEREKWGEEEKVEEWREKRRDTLSPTTTQNMISVSRNMIC